jgi:DNA polymerase III delta prime subunit
VQQLCCWWNWNPNWDHNRKPGIPNCPASAETLECAKKHIMNFVMVGIQEEFDDSISLLLWKTGMRDNRGAIRMHANTFRGKKKYVPTPEEEAEVRASSAWDYALYEFAKEKFHSDILEMKTKLRLP